MSTAYPELTRRRRLRGFRGANVDVSRLRQAAPLAGLLTLTAVVYLWALSRNGWANQYYAAAVQAGTHSWTAFLFGSLDPANYITVDKPPASLWLMELSTRVFGFSSTAMLLPQALEGVAAVALLYATVRRWFKRPAALLAGLILALTPVAALMFRFNNPDALLVLLLVVAAYSLTRALEGGSTRWLALCGAALGFGFLTKELEAFLVLPAFAAAYLVAAPVSLRRRAGALVVAGAALVASAGWWVALVELWPASGRPYIGGSTNNSILQLIFGYNGLDRISSGSAGGGPGGAGGFSGAAGILRLFNAELGGQIAWLLPAAGIAGVAAAIWTARAPRSDRTRAAVLVWGGWLVITAAVFSFMSGIIHPYYTNILAPPIAVLVGVGSVLAWQRRSHLTARLLLGAMLAATGACSFLLLARTPSWHPWLRFTILAASILISAALVGGRRLKTPTRRLLATAGLIAALAGPSAYTLGVVGTAKAGSNPSAGPVNSFGGGGPGGATVSTALAARLEGDASRYTWVAATSSAQNGASLELATGQAVMAIGGFSGSDSAITLARFEQLVAQGKIHYYVAGGGPGSGFGRGGLGSPRGGSGNGLGPPGGALGGFGPPGGGGLPGGGGFPGGGGGFPGVGFPGGPGARSGVASQIQSWVESHFKATTLGGSTIYDLTQPKAS